MNSKRQEHQEEGDPPGSGRAGTQGRMTRHEETQPTRKLNGRWEKENSEAKENELGEEKGC